MVSKKNNSKAGRKKEQKSSSKTSLYQNETRTPPHNTEAEEAVLGR